MDLQELGWLLDYARRHNMMKCSIIQVIEAWNRDLEEAYKSC